MYKRHHLRGNAMLGSSEAFEYKNTDMIFVPETTFVGLHKPMRRLRVVSTSMDTIGKFTPLGAIDSSALIPYSSTNLIFAVK
jgi:hypothetical protein